MPSPLASPLSPLAQTLKHTLRWLIALVFLMLIASCGGGGGDAPPSSAKDITTFNFTKSNNTALSTDIAGTVSGATIAVTLPYGLDRTALIASFTALGVSVKVGAVLQTSGASSLNFSKPVSYEVKAADGSLKYYTVTVVNAPVTAKDITSFAFTPAANSGLASSIEGTISGETIGVVLPQGVSRSVLAATFSSTGASVGVGGAVQASGVTVLDFTNPVVYTATAADGSSKNYTVTVGNAATSAAQITSFSVLGINANITGTTIALTLPFGVSRSALVATFSSTGASVKVAGKAQVSGSSSNNFEAPLAYLVTADDGSTSSYTVSVNNLLNNANDISAFSVAGVNGNIVGTAISVTLPYGMARTALVATFSSTGDTVRVGTQLQTSGLTSNSFAAPLIYTVTAQDGSTKDYTVAVGNAANAAKDITAFSVLGVNGSIAGSAITVTLPYGTDHAALIATFVSTGNMVRVGGMAQVSGTTGNNFSNPMVYTVTADDGSTKTYTVTITNALNPAKDITTFSINGVNASIDGSNLTLTLPIGTSRGSLIATFAATGVSVAVGGILQTTGSTPNNFSNPVAYTVTAEDGTSKIYIVSIIVPMPRSEISYPGASSSSAFTAIEPYTINVMGVDTSVQLYGASRTYDFSGDQSFVNSATSVADPWLFLAWDPVLGASRNISSKDITNAGYPGRIEKQNGMTVIRYNAGDGITGGTCRTQVNSYAVPPRTHVRFELEVAFGANDGVNEWVLTTPAKSPVLFWQLKSPSGTNPSMSAVVDTDPNDPTRSLAISFFRKGGLAAKIQLIGTVNGLPRNTLIPVVVEAFLDEREIADAGKGRMKITVNGNSIADVDGPTLTYGPGENNWSMDMYLYNELSPYSNTRASFWKTARLFVYP